jgi:hypothetical protein
MGRFGRSLSVLILIVSVPLAAAAGDGLSPQKAFEDCIVRHASQPPSPQAAVILQRACFYKFLYGKNYLTTEEAAAEHRKLSKVYTSEVCDCLFEKMPSINPGIPATAVLDSCVKSTKKP